MKLTKARLQQIIKEEIAAVTEQKPRSDVFTPQESQQLLMQTVDGVANELQSLNFHGDEDDLLRIIKQLLRPEISSDKIIFKYAPHTELIGDHFNKYLDPQYASDRFVYKPILVSIWEMGRKRGHYEEHRGNYNSRREEAFVRAVMKNMRGRGWDPKKVKQQIKADAEQKYFQPQDYEK